MKNEIDYKKFDDFVVTKVNEDLKFALKGYESDYEEYILYSKIYSRLHTKYEKELDDENFRKNFYK